MQRIIVLGGNGRIGREVALAFHKQGFETIITTRNGLAKGSLPSDIKIIAVDCLNKAELVSACSGVDFIFNGLNPIYTKWQAEVLPLAENVIAAAIKAKAIHLFPGNVYNYGSSMPEHISPDVEQVPDSRKGQIRQQAEAMFQKASKTHALKTIIIRAGDFFGGTMAGSWFDEVITQKIHKDIITYPGPTNILHAWAYLPDFAQAFVSVAKNADKFETFKEFAFAGHTITGQDIKQTIEGIVQKALKLKGLPWSLIKFAGLIVPMMREISEVSYLWRTPHQLQDRELSALIDADHSTPLDQALKQSLIDLDRLPDPAHRQAMVAA